MLPPFCKQNHLLFIQPRWQPRTYFFNHYDVLFLMNLHSPSKSNTNSTQIRGFLLMCVSFTTGYFHTCVFCKECSLYPVVYSLLILGLVFSDCVVFYGDSFLWELHGEYGCSGNLADEKSLAASFGCPHSRGFCFFSRAVHSG